MSTEGVLFLLYVGAGVMVGFVLLMLSGLFTGKAPGITVWQAIGLVSLSLMVVAYGMAPPVEPPVTEMHVQYGEGTSIGEPWVYTP